jgi:hypothetical protein
MDRSVYGRLYVCVDVGIYMWIRQQVDELAGEHCLGKCLYAILRSLSCVPFPSCGRWRPIIPDQAMLTQQAYCLLLDPSLVLVMCAVQLLGSVEFCSCFLVRDEGGLAEWSVKW